MTHDSSKDPRILVAHRACALLKQTLQQKSRVKLHASRDRVVEMAAGLDSSVMALMYTYQEPADLAVSPMTEEIVDTAGEVAEALEPVISSPEAPPLIRANFLWCLRTLKGLAGRFSNSGATLASGVDLLAVQVRNVITRGKLWLTPVTDGTTDYTVMTNIPKIQAGDVLAVAFLPPREVGGEVSEAMYLGEERRKEPPGTLLDENDVDAREASGILHDEIQKH
jgi:predicted RNA-binding protein with EMAP domain